MNKPRVIDTRMRNLVPTKIFLTKGVGRHMYQLKSFEDALRKAGVAQQNLVQVSSILPPQCKVISCEAGLKLLTPGEIRRTDQRTRVCAVIKTCSRLYR